jgi:hypothetical protein
VALVYLHLLVTQQVATSHDWVVGVPVGIALNYVGILKPIDWLAERNSPFRFATRQLRPADR